MGIKEKIQRYLGTNVQVPEDIIQRLIALELSSMIIKQILPSLKKDLEALSLRLDDTGSSIRQLQLIAKDQATAIKTLGFTESSHYDAVGFSLKDLYKISSDTDSKLKALSEVVVSPDPKQDLKPSIERLEATLNKVMESVSKLVEDTTMSNLT